MWDKKNKPSSVLNISTALFLKVSNLIDRIVLLERRTHCGNPHLAAKMIIKEHCLLAWKTSHWEHRDSKINHGFFLLYCEYELHGRWFRLQNGSRSRVLMRNAGSAITESPRRSNPSLGRAQSLETQWEPRFSSMQSTDTLTSLNTEG